MYRQDMPLHTRTTHRLHARPIDLLWFVLYCTVLASLLGSSRYRTMIFLSLSPCFFWSFLVRLLFPLVFFLSFPPPLVTDSYKFNRVTQSTVKPLTDTNTQQFNDNIPKYTLAKINFFAKHFDCHTVAINIISDTIRWTHTMLLNIRHLYDP